MRSTKYRLESLTVSTAMPGYSSTGAWANSSPEGSNKKKSVCYVVCFGRGGRGIGPVLVQHDNISKMEPATSILATLAYYDESERLYAQETIISMFASK